MWLKLYVKHVFVCIRRDPLQPVLSVLVLALAFLLAAMSFRVRDALEEDSRLRQQALYGSADITVTLNASSESRFLQTEDALAVAGVRAAAGSYEVPLQAEGKTLFASAVDLGEIGAVFRFSFTEYMGLPQGEQAHALFLTERAARESGLRVGEETDASVLGCAMRLKVYGISPHAFAGGCEAMISAGGLMRALAASSPFLAALGEDFRLFSTLYIVADDAQAAARLLRAEEAFADKTVSVVEGEAVASANLGALGPTVAILVVFIALVSAAVVFCCFYLLSARRAQQSALFIHCGAPPRAMLALQCAEIVLYWLAGGVLGCAAACALAVPFFHLCGFEYLTDPFGAGFALNCLSALGVTLLSSLLTALFFCLADAHRRRAKGGGKLRGAFAAVLAGTLFLIAAVCTALLPASLHTVTAPAACICFFLFVFPALPPVLRAAAARLARRPQRRGGMSAALRYAAANVRSVRTLHNSARLFAVLLSAAVILGMVVASGSAYVGATYRYFSADLLLLNAGPSAAQSARACEETESACAFYWSVGYGSDRNIVNMLAAEDFSFLSEEFRPDVLPKGKGIVLTRAFAEYYACKEGDEIVLEVEGKDAAFTVLSLIDCRVNTAYFDAEALGVGYNHVAVTGREGVGQEELRLALSEELVLDMVAAVTPESFFRQRLSIFDVYLASGNVLLAGVILFSAVGIADNVYEGYRSRRKEFALYAQCGMDRRTLGRMKALEMALSAAVSLVCAACMTGVLLLLIDNWMQGFAVDFFLVFFS